MVEDELDCGRRCLGRDGCISYNYGYQLNHRGHTCELNSQTKEAEIDDYEEKPGFQYYGSLNEREVLNHIGHFRNSITLLFRARPGE